MEHATGLQEASSGEPRPHRRHRRRRKRVDWARLRSPRVLVRLAMVAVMLTGFLFARLITGH